MSLDDLREYVWKRLPMRRYMVGRRVVNDLVTLAVENWEGEYLGHADTEEGREIVGMSIASRVKRAHQWQSGKEPQEYSMIWMLMLGAVVSGVVQVLIRWWFERQTNRVLMAGWQQELTR
jgi:transcription elongation factor GreA-like protein